MPPYPAVLRVDVGTEYVGIFARTASYVADGPQVFSSLPVVQLVWYAFEISAGYADVVVRYGVCLIGDIGVGTAAVRAMNSGSSKSSERFTVPLSCKPL